MSIWVYEYNKIMRICVYECTSIWVYGYMSIWVYEYMGILVCELVHLYYYMLSALDGRALVATFGVTAFVLEVKVKKEVTSESSKDNKYKDIGMYVCMWVYECVSVWVYQYMSTRVYGYMSTWVYEYMSIWV